MVRVTGFCPDRTLTTPDRLRGALTQMGGRGRRGKKRQGALSTRIIKEHKPEALDVGLAATIYPWPKLA